MRIVSLALLVLAFLVSGSAAAVADDTRLGLSRDGVSWASSITAPLFDPEIRWVPGDSRVRSFFARNESSDRAQLSVDVLDSSTDALIRTGDLEVSARSGSGPWTDVSAAGRHRVVDWVPTSAGDVTQIDIRVRFTPSSNNQSQQLPLNLIFRAVLRATDPVEPTPPVIDGDATVPAVDQSHDSGALLPDTGAPVFWTLFAAAALLIAGFIVAPSRREPEEESSHV